MEAGLMGFRVVGYDIVPSMVDSARKNLEHYGIKNAVLMVVDAFKTHPEADAIVTDLPYGKNTKAKEPVQRMLNDFLKRVLQWNVSRMVVMVPSTVKAESEDWEIHQDFQYYIHRSMTKRILVMVRSPR